MKLERRLDLKGQYYRAVLWDQLHPPMVYDEEIWRKSRNWRVGAQQCTRRLAEKVGINSLDRVLDIGCGIGGPARMLAREYGDAGCRH